MVFAPKQMSRPTGRPTTPTFAADSDHGVMRSGEVAVVPHAVMPTEPLLVARMAATFSTGFGPVVAASTVVGVMRAAVVAPSTRVGASA